MIDGNRELGGHGGVSFLCIDLKGQCHEIFDFWFFHESVSPKPLSIPLWPCRICSKIRGDIRSSRCTTGAVETRSKKSRDTVPLKVMIGGSRAQGSWYGGVSFSCIDFLRFFIWPVSLSPGRPASVLPSAAGPLKKILDTKTTFVIVCKKVAFQVIWIDKFWPSFIWENIKIIPPKLAWLSSNYEGKNRQFLKPWGSIESWA